LPGRTAVTLCSQGDGVGFLRGVVALYVADVAFYVAGGFPLFLHKKSSSSAFLPDKTVAHATDAAVISFLFISFSFVTI
jgi:hypothetical protein